MATRAATLQRNSLGRSSPRPTPRGGARPASRSPRPSRDAQLRVVPKNGQQARSRARSRGRRRLVTICTALTIALAFGVAVSHVIVAQNQNRLDSLNRRLDEAQERYEQLRFQVAELESPERVVAAAQDRLGMTEPAEVKYVAPVALNNNAAEERAVTDAPDWRLVKAELAAR